MSRAKYLVQAAAGSTKAPPTWAVVTMQATCDHCPKPVITSRVKPVLNISLKNIRVAETLEYSTLDFHILISVV